MDGQLKNSKKKYRADIIVISAILLISLIFLCITLLTKREGTLAVVEVDGVTIGSYPLYTDGIFVLNGGTNTLVIENGKAYLTNSHCPDHTCEKTGKVGYVGQSIVCLPNRLSVLIKGDGDGVDFVS